MALICPMDNIFEDVLQLNLIASITLPSLEENLIEVQITQDIFIGGSLSVLDRSIYPRENFGEVDEDSVVPTLELDFEEVALLPQIVRVNGDNVAVRFCLEDNAEGFFTFITTFTVNGAVCNVNGQQAIPAGWVSLLEAGFLRIGVDFTLPLGNNGFDEAFQPAFEPNTASQVSFEEDAANDQFTIFIPFSNAEIGYEQDQEGVQQDIFLFLGNTNVPNAVNCSSVEENVEEVVNLLGLVIVALPLLACCCFIGVVLSNNMVETTTTPGPDGRRTRRFRFPGSPDIVVAPGNSLEASTVQAVLEENDNQDLDAAVPVTTIDVHMASERSLRAEEDARNRFVTI